MACACASGGDERYFGATTRHGRAPTTFYLNGHDEPETLDPGRSSDRAATTLLLELFEGLAVLDPRDLHPTAGVAESWDQSSDNRLFRFHLRPDARWSDGRPVTAGDFLYAWRRVLDPAFGARMATMLYCLRNAADHHQQRIGRLVARTELRAEPAGAVAAALVLEAGSAVRVVERAKRDAGAWLRVEPFDGRPSFVPSERPALRPPAPEGAGGGTAPAQSGAAVRQGWVEASQVEADPTLLGLRAVDDRTLEVELAEPTPYFLELLTYPTLFPVRQDLVERFAAAGRPDEWTRPENLISNGPYVLDSWAFRYQITMKRNPYHPDHDRLRVQRIVWLQVPQHNPTMNLYKAGELDYLGSDVALPSTHMARLSRYQDFVRSQYLATYWYELNVSKPPLDDVRVRRALNLAIDKQQLVDTITRSGQLPATHFVPDFTGSGYAAAAEADRRAGADPFHGPGLDYDPALGRELLGQAGYPVSASSDGLRADGFPALEVLYNAGEGHQRIAVAIQSMWRRDLGISVSLRSEEWKVMLENIRNGNYQVARFGWTADYNHPHTWLDTFLSYSAQNWSRWKNPQFDKLVAEAAATADPVESIRLYRRAERLAVDELPRIPLYFFSKSTMVKPYVKGFYPNARNEHPVRFMWIDENWRSGSPNRPAFEPREFPPPGHLVAP